MEKRTKKKTQDILSSQIDAVSKKQRWFLFFSPKIRRKKGVCFVEKGKLRPFGSNRETFGSNISMSIYDGQFIATGFSPVGHPKRS